ncbi:MAG: methylenetetrahydrofolate reductase [Alphaproteobacteria bacterium]|nr:methylenetetrahydrofolate reductase [Alphaproteobacteria bacterium]
MATKAELDAVADLAKGFSIEVTPTTAEKVADFRDILTPGTLVNVTFLPGTDNADTVKTAKRLTDEGMVPVPHVAVRSIASEQGFRTYLKGLTQDAGVTEILLIGGEVDDPKGPFADTVQVLEAGLLDNLGLKRVHVGGHPEGNPRVGYDKTMEFLKRKVEVAGEKDIPLALITQFVFEAKPVIDWIADMKSHGIELPVAVGVPGPAKIKTLVSYAKACGIGPSINFILRQAANVTKLLTVNQPDTLLLDLAAYRTREGAACAIDRLHMYPFGGVAKTSEWSTSVARGHLAPAKSPTAFTVTDDVALKAAS